MIDESEDEETEYKKPIISPFIHLKKWLWISIKYTGLVAGFP
jgi:hypothetical protein